MRVLIVGGGGREHALAWAFARSADRPTLFVAPGNAGTARIATNLALAVDQPTQILEAVRREGIDLVVIGPEAPLVAGVADLLREHGVLVFGCSRAAAEIEGSKAYCKDLLHRYEIATAAFGVFSNAQKAELFIDARLSRDARIVVKADGLAAGKGVHICHGASDAKRAARTLIGQSGRIVVEEFLVGREASLLAFVVDEEVVLLPSAEDHKTIFDDDRGPMTGGMGVVCPTPVLDELTTRRALDELVRPTAQALCKDGRPFRGLLFAGLMITAEGPKVLEYNCRFGDPETEAIVARLDSGARGDLLAAIESVARGRSPKPLAFRDDASVSVVMAQAGYPGKLQRSVELGKLEDVDALVFHAGTTLEGDRVKTAGGRVLAVTGVGADVHAARAQAYRAVEQIEFPGAQFRRDIGARPSERV